MENTISSYVLIPENYNDFHRELNLPLVINGKLWEAADNISLGGYFYDHVCKANGTIIGIRYWAIDSISLHKNFVLQFFSQDERFFFDTEGRFVDIIFEQKNVELFKCHTLLINPIQDFGGVCAIRNNNLYGIFVSL